MSDRVRKITKADMQQLREVLKGDDKTSMWASLNRMKLSPKDKVGMQKSEVMAVLAGWEVEFLPVFLVPGLVLRHEYLPSISRQLLSCFYHRHPYPRAHNVLFICVLLVCTPVT